MSKTAEDRIVLEKFILDLIQKNKDRVVAVMQRFNQYGEVTVAKIIEAYKGPSGADFARELYQVYRDEKMPENIKSEAKKTRPNLMVSNFEGSLLGPVFSRPFEGVILGSKELNDKPSQVDAEPKKWSLNQFVTVLDSASKLIGNLKGGVSEVNLSKPAIPNATTPNILDEAEESVPFYKKPLVIGIGVAIVLFIGALVLKKKR
jgi:hypothetical protein